MSTTPPSHTQALSVADLTGTLLDVANNHLLQLPHESEFADWCLSIPYCTWSPNWHHRNDDDLVRDEHTEHVAVEQAKALHRRLNPNADN